MSRGANLTIIGLYEFNPDIFEGLTVPQGMDRAEVINNILLECGDLSLIYPSYTILKLAIKNWSVTEGKIWDKLFNTENLEYNPIWNVDGKIIEKGSAGSVGSTKGYNDPGWLPNSKADTNDTREITRTGNIGVTTTQKMIQEERDIADFTTYKYITESFKKRFCLMIY